MLGAVPCVSMASVRLILWRRPRPRPLRVPSLKGDPWPAGVVGGRPDGWLESAWYCPPENFSGSISGAIQRNACALQKCFTNQNSCFTLRGTMVKEVRKLINFRAPSQSVSDLESVAAGWSCSQTEAILRLISEGVGRVTNGDGFALQVEGEAQTVLRWWMRQDGMTEREVVEAALLIYDEFRQRPGAKGGSASSEVPSTLTPEVAGREHGFPMNCRHCRQGKQGATKFASICFDCKRDGHTNDPAECPVCMDWGTGAL